MALVQNLTLTRINDFCKTWNSPLAPHLNFVQTFGNVGTFGFFPFVNVSSPISEIFFQTLRIILENTEDFGQANIINSPLYLWKHGFGKH